MFFRVAYAEFMEQKGAVETVAPEKDEIWC